MKRCPTVVVVSEVGNLPEHNLGIADSVAAALADANGVQNTIKFEESYRSRSRGEYLKHRDDFNLVLVDTAFMRLDLDAPSAYRTIMDYLGDEDKKSPEYFAVVTDESRLHVGDFLNSERHRVFDANRPEDLLKFFGYS